MKLGRVLSPHLSIYRKQLTSVMSIFLRISGAALGLGVWIIGLTALLSKMDINALAEKVESLDLSGTTFTVLKFLIILPFSYHLMAGIRHLAWYLNVFLTKPEIYITGYVALVMSLLLAACLALVSVEPQQIEPKEVGQVQDPEYPILEEDTKSDMVPEALDECDETQEDIKPVQKGCLCED